MRVGAAVAAADGAATADDASAGKAREAHLSYCTNIHSGESWREIRDSVETYCGAVKARVSPSRPFGVGLRLPAAAAEELSEPAPLREFLDLLERAGLYVYTINGFPYGKFHGGRVKEEVYLPDWRSDARLEYTDRLAELLAVLLPNGLRGSISTVPGAFRHHVKGAADERCIARQLARHVARLVDIERRTGQTIRTALEPEPCCLIETLAEAVQFFERRLLARDVRELLARETGLDVQTAEGALRKHLGVCLDLCHAAVEFEDIQEALAALDAAGIAVPKVQISAGMRLPSVTPEDVERLRSFDDAVYLHQVVERSPGGLRRYLDLAEACDAFEPDAAAREWRVHFHVPIFLEHMDIFETTRSGIEEALRIHRQKPISDHFEVETYTFEVLPPRYRDADVVTQICREVEWAAGQLRA